MDWPTTSCGERALPRPSVRARPRRPTGGTGNAPVTRRSRAMGTASPCASPRISGYSAEPRADAITGSRSSGHASNPSRVGTTLPRSRTTATCSTAALEAGVEPWVCLHHFTLPRWFADARRFPGRGQPRATLGTARRFIAETFGDLAGGWQPVNETNYYALAAYLGGGWPPGHDDPERVRTGRPERSSWRPPRRQCGCGRPVRRSRRSSDCLPSKRCDDDSADAFGWPTCSTR